MSAQKRKQPHSSMQLPRLSEPELKLYQFILSRTTTGTWTADMTKETGLSLSVVGKAQKSLESKNLIKQVKHVKYQNRKVFMAVEFEPSKEISGGSWYSGGNLDKEFIRILRQQCLKHVEKLKVATVVNIWESIRESPIFVTGCTTMEQISEIVQLMVFDKEIEELKSTGAGELSRIPIGKICYRSLRYREGLSTFASMPCGVCPRMNDCTPDGMISPITCEYYNKWLDMDF